jgi:hypothetical protein
VAGGLAAAFADAFPDAYAVTQRFADAFPDACAAVTQRFAYRIAASYRFADAYRIAAAGYERCESDDRLDPRGDARAVTKSGDPLATKVIGTLILVSMRRCGDGEDSSSGRPRDLQRIA